MMTDGLLIKYWWRMTMTYARMTTHPPYNVENTHKKTGKKHKEMHDETSTQEIAL